MAKQSKWRARARHVIDTIVTSHGALIAEQRIDELIALIDDAYPFGERKYHPYKMWLIERQKTVAWLTERDEPRVNVHRDTHGSDNELPLFAQGGSK